MLCAPSRPGRKPGCTAVSGVRMCQGERMKAECAGSRTYLATCSPCQRRPPQLSARATEHTWTHAAQCQRVAARWRGRTLERPSARRRLPELEQASALCPGQGCVWIKAAARACSPLPATNHVGPESSRAAWRPPRRLLPRRNDLVGRTAHLLRIHPHHCNNQVSRKTGARIFTRRTAA